MLMPHLFLEEKQAMSSHNCAIQLKLREDQNALVIR